MVVVVFMVVIGVGVAVVPACTIIQFLAHKLWGNTCVGELGVRAMVTIGVGNTRGVSEYTEWVRNKVRNRRNLDAPKCFGKYSSEALISMRCA